MSDTPFWSAALQRKVRADMKSAEEAFARHRKREAERAPRDIEDRVQKMLDEYLSTHPMPDLDAISRQAIALRRLLEKELQSK
jgi:hypothetical protein